MRSRMKEDEKNEKIIRGLLKLPQNKRCINCNNLGPQYVCTNFWTFICTNCSGIHREFCHRVKSISMAKFTSQEVSALQEGGNERAKDIYFKEWDPQRHSVLDSSNIDRLRDLIKHVYEDRRYTGERSTDRPPRAKPDNPNESSRGDSSRGDSRSPPYDDRFNERLGTTGRNDERNFRFLQGEKSPGYNQGDGKRNPRHFEVVDNRQREDRFGNGNQNRKFEDRRLPEVVKPEGSSPNRQKDFSTSSPPTVRPVKDILGGDMLQLRVGDLPKSNGIVVPNNPAQAQRTSSSSSMGSSDGNSAQVKTVNDVSLIDFSADPEPSVITAPQPSVAQTTAAAPQPSVLQTTSSPSNAGDWASFDVVSQQNVPQAAANASTLGSSTAPLSQPGSTSMVNTSVLPIPGIDSSLTSNNGGQWSTMQHNQPSLFPAGDGRSAFSTPNTHVAAFNNQSLGSQLPQNSQRPLSSSTVHPSQFAGKLLEETSTGFSSQSSSVESKPIERKELPADLFAALYPSMPMPVSNWPRGTLPNMGYGMQYPMATTMPTFLQSSKSMNPFDLGSEPPPSQFPSMAPMQAALPNMSGPSPLMRSSSFGNPSPQAVPHQHPSFSPAFSPSPYMMQQIPNNMHQQLPSRVITMGHQGPGGSGSGGAAFGNIGMDQVSAARYHYSQPSTPNSFGTGGNPFG